MIQDIGPSVFDNSYIREAAKPEDQIMIFKGRELYVRLDEEGMVYLPSCADLKVYEGMQFLFKIDDIQYWLWLEDELPVLEGYIFKGLRSVYYKPPVTTGFATLTGWHLYLWYKDNRFCGRCGGRMMAGKKERNLRCPECGGVVYPKIAPAVIVGVYDGDRLLMTRYAGREYKGAALIAGFCEIGESAETTVAREVMEEAGVKVKNIRYFGSQPWGMEQDLLLGFWAEADGDTSITMDEEELSSAVWVERPEIPEMKSTGSLTATMIEYFRTHTLDEL